MTACRRITLVLYVIGLSIFVDTLAMPKINRISLVVMTTPDRRQVVLYKGTLEGIKKWMLPGQVLGDGDTMHVGAVRTLEQLTGANNHALTHVGTYLFTMGDPTSTNADLPPIHFLPVYVTEACRADLKQSKHLKWFDVDDLPSDEMFETEKHWLPLALRMQKFEGFFAYDPEHDQIISYKLETEGYE